MLRSELMAVLGKLALVLALCAAVPVAFWLALARTNAEVERATATAVGRVERVDRGRGSSAVVTWTDAHGARHSGRFALTDPDRYHPGDAYPLRYDPDGTDPRAVPAEAEDVSALRDLQLVPLLLSAAAGAAVAVFWTGRAARYLLVLRSPSVPGTARAGRASHGRNASRPVVHVRWHGPSGAVHEGWQPVMPGRGEAALRGSDAADATAVTVHQRTAGGRVVLVLPDGSSLVPSDHLNSREPTGWDDRPEPPLPYRLPATSGARVAAPLRPDRDRGGSRHRSGRLVPDRPGHRHRDRHPRGRGLRRNGNVAPRSPTRPLSPPVPFRKNPPK